MAMDRMLPGMARVRERRTKEEIGRHLLLCLAWLSFGSGLGAIPRWFSSTSFPHMPYCGEIWHLLYMRHELPDVYDLVVLHCELYLEVEGSSVSTRKVKWFC